jgi:hypothetical protein
MLQCNSEKLYILLPVLKDRVLKDFHKNAKIQEPGLYNPPCEELTDVVVGSDSTLGNSQLLRFSLFSIEYLCILVISHVSIFTNYS